MPWELFVLPAIIFFIIGVVNGSRYLKNEEEDF